MIKTFKTIMAGIIMASSIFVFASNISITEEAKAAARTVTLHLNAIDDLSGVQLMQVATDLSNPPAPIPFQKTYSFSTDATTIYVRISDAAGNWSPWETLTVNGPSVSNSGYPTAKASAPSTFVGGGGGGGGAPLPPVIATSPSASSSPSATASPSPTLTPSATPTPSPTPSVTPTPSPSPTASSVSTPTRSPTPVSSTQGSPTPAPATQTPPAESVKSSKTDNARPTVAIPPLTQSEIKIVTSTKVLAIPASNASVTNFAVVGNSSSSIKANSSVGKAFSISLPKLPIGTKVTYAFVESGKKLDTISASTIKSSSAGSLPALSFKAPGKYTLLVTIGKITKTITITVNK